MTDAGLSPPARSIVLAATVVVVLLVDRVRPQPSR